MAPERPIGSELFKAKAIVIVKLREERNSFAFLTEHETRTVYEEQRVLSLVTLVGFRALPCWQMLTSTIVPVIR